MIYSTGRERVDNARAEGTSLPIRVMIIITAVVNIITRR